MNYRNSIGGDPKLDMVLTDADIKMHMKEGWIVIHPFRREQLNNASYNVSIGEHYYVQKEINTEINPFNKGTVASMWKHVYAGLDGSIKIPAGQTVMCHTQEFIGSKIRSVPILKSRSSMMRCCLNIAAGAGWGDVGYTSRWAFTIQNTGVNDITIPVGSQVAQLVFIPIFSGTAPYNGSYQAEVELEEIMSNWHHSCILPKPTSC